MKDLYGDFITDSLPYVAARLADSPEDFEDIIDDCDDEAPVIAERDVRLLLGSGKAIVRPLRELRKVSLSEVFPSYFRPL